MIMEEILLEEIRKLILPVLSQRGIELIELLMRRERGRSVLRFLVDKSGGITLDDCARLNQEIGRILDEQNIIQQSYVLEVSSPGLDRPLKSTRDFERAMEKPVRIVLHKPVHKQNVWTGFLDAVDQASIVIRTEKQQRLQIARQDIARANLEVEA